MIFILVVLGIIIAAIVLALVFVPMLIDESAIIALAQEQVRAATGGELTVEGDVDIALFPELVLKLGDTTLDMPPQGEGSGRMLAEVASVDVGMSIMGALLGEAEFGDVRLDGTNVTLFDENGKVATKLEVSELLAERLNIADNPMGLKGKLTVVNLDGGESIVVSFNGDIRVPKDIDRITLDALDTRITGALTKPIESTLSGNVILAPLKADLDLLLKLPGGDITGDLVYAAVESPQIDLVFNSERLDLDQLQPANAGAADAEEPAQPTPQAPPVPVAVGPLKDLDMRLAITANALLTAGQEITNAQLLLRVVDGITDLKYLRGVMHEGQLDTNMQIDVREPVIKATIAGGLKGVELNSLLTSLDSPDTAAGHVDMDWDLKTRGTTPEALKLGIEGDMQVSGRSVDVLAVSAQNLMCQAIAQVNQKTLSQPMPETTKVSALGMTVKFDDGKAKLTDLDLATPGVALGGTGEVDLQSMNFSARVQANVDESLRQLDPACSVDERYVALDWPVKCAGNLNSANSGEWCRVDVDSIVQQLLQNEAKNQVQKQIDKLGKDAGSALKKLFGN